MRAPRPLLGITACARRLGGERAQAVMERYIAAAARHADCVPVLIPSCPDMVAADEIVARLDGVLLTGSASNVMPANYGEECAGEGPFDAGRDQLALSLVAACRAAAKPVFGICRGFQEINVAFGGTLARNLGDASRPLSHHADQGADLDQVFAHSHAVTLARKGILHRAFGTERLAVNSVHFQGIERLGTGLTVEARADDGVIEAVAGPPEGAPIQAGQWHPEWAPDDDAAGRAFFALLGKALRRGGIEGGSEP